MVLLSAPLAFAAEGTPMKSARCVFRYAPAGHAPEEYTEMYSSIFASWADDGACTQAYYSCRAAHPKDAWNYCHKLSSAAVADARIAEEMNSCTVYHYTDIRYSPHPVSTHTVYYARAAGSEGERQALKDAAHFAYLKCAFAAEPRYCEEEYSALTAAHVGAPYSWYQCGEASLPSTRF